MGWFWSDPSGQPVAAAKAVAPHPLPSEGAAPPPGCPMHAASKPTSFPPQTGSSPPPQSCPVKQSSSTPPTSNQPSAPSTLSKLNPLNYMPKLSNTRGADQTYSLPTNRELSSIPRGDADSNWEYPSPQQMYNAMLRKGGIDDSQTDAVESMVAVHNYLNEGAWAEIRGWEKRFSNGLGKGWRTCLQGEQTLLEEDETRSVAVESGEPKLLRFMGRPRDLTPKAQVLQWMGWAWPTKYATEPPFDRHDWFVLRHTARGKTKEVRYVIDYYSAPPEPTGEPVFYLDVRPAIDGPTAACERMMRWGGDVWFRASGAAARS